MAGGVDGEKVKLWRRRLRRQARWAGTVEEFCRDEGISIPTFYYWRKKLAGSGVSRQPAERRAFRAVLVTPSVTALSARLPGGIELEVPAGNLEVIRLVVGELTRAQPGTAAGVHSC